MDRLERGPCTNLSSGRASAAAKYLDTVGFHEENGPPSELIPEHQKKIVHPYPGQSEPTWDCREDAAVTVST